jgi:predicted enzyme related to lactoylglutathione lyase
MPFYLKLFRPGVILILGLILGACNTIRDSEQTTDARNNPYPAGTFIWHDLLTHDIAAARQFYGELFGWKFEKGPDREGKSYILAKLNGRYAAGILQLERPEDGSNYSRWLGYMTVDDIEIAQTTARSAGGTVYESSREIGEVGKVAAIADSQSAVLGLIEARFDASGISLNNTPGAIVWDELLASDSQQAAAFYSRLAAFSVNTIERRGGEYIFLENQGEAKAGILKNPFDNTDPIWLSYFAVQDPVAIANKAQALGGKILIAPSVDLREGTIALIQDPDGVILALQKWPR